MTCPRTGYHVAISSLQALTHRGQGSLDVKGHRIENTNILQVPIDRKKGAIFHSHRPIEPWIVKNTQAKVITILRNYREIAIRELYADNPRAKKMIHDMASLENLLLPRLQKYYIALLNNFDKLPKSRRYMYKYEDMLLDPKNTLNGILEFLNESTENLDEFVANIDGHRKKILRYYDNYWKKASQSGSVSKGSSVTYHSDNAPKYLVALVDQLLKTHVSPHIWDTYLAQYCTPLAQADTNNLKESR